MIGIFRFRKAFKKINKFITVLAYFTLNSWTFGYQHTTELWKGLNEVDKKNFSFDMKSLNWDHYFDTYYVALREILLEEPLDNLLEGEKHINRYALYGYFELFLIFIFFSQIDHSVLHLCSTSTRTISLFPS